MTCAEIRTGSASMTHPWISLLCLEMFQLKKDARFLEWAYRCLKAYYNDGGHHFYAIGIPMYESVSLLRGQGMEKEAQELLECFPETCGLYHGMREKLSAS